MTRWFDEIINYNWTTGVCKAGKKCGHYTQLMWADSDQIGCGFSHCEGIVNVGYNFLRIEIIIHLILDRK